MIKLLAIYLLGLLRTQLYRLKSDVHKINHTGLLAVYCYYVGPTPVIIYSRRLGEVPCFYIHIKSLKQGVSFLELCLSEVTSLFCLNCVLVGVVLSVIHSTFRLFRCSEQQMQLVDHKGREYPYKNWKSKVCFDKGTFFQSLEFKVHRCPYRGISCFQKCYTSEKNNQYVANNFYLFNGYDQH